jgi:hypothetical protein
VRATDAGRGALFDEHGVEGVKAAEQRVGIASGQAGDDAVLRHAVHRLAKHRSRSRPIPHRSSLSGRPWPPVMSCFKCFRRFILMFQVFDLNVAKVDLGCCICCNDNIRMLQAYVFECFSCFKSMFQVFHHDVVEVYLDVA